MKNKSEKLLEILHSLFIEWEDFCNNYYPSKSMKKYLVRFTTKDGDYDKEWCYADSKEEASNKIMREHWNIAHIDLVEEI